MQTDFDRWLVYHGGAYAGFAKWTTENAAQLRFMRRMLEQYTIEQLSAATDRLYALDEQPRGYGEHARKIRSLITAGQGITGQSEHYGPSVKDDHLVAFCWRCMDYGIVSVLSPLTIKRISSQDPGHGILTCAIRCDCERGKRVGGRLPIWEDGHLLVRYDDVIDEAATSHRDMLDVACEMVACKYQEIRPHAVELTGESLP